jgi:hypothetical protein
MNGLLTAKHVQPLVLLRIQITLRRHQLITITCTQQQMVSGKLLKHNIFHGNYQFTGLINKFKPTQL